MEAYKKIWKAYERANFIATLGNVDRWREEAVSLFYAVDGRSPVKVLDAGAGPGNMARHLRGVRYVVALDATPEMLYVNTTADEKVVGVFEYMPFRDKGFDLLLAGYSLHASIDIERAIAEFNRVSLYQCVVSIGNPNNKFVRKLLSIYTKFILPKLVCLITPKEVCKEYKKIHLIISSIPPNAKIREIVGRYSKFMLFKERGFGSVYIYFASSSNFT